MSNNNNKKNMDKKPDWLFRQSGVIAVHDGHVVLITAIKSKRWIIPKGVVEKDMSPPDSAAKEALEEAGILGIVNPNEIGRYQYNKWGGTCTVQVYVMYVEKLLEEWDEKDARTRKVVTPDQAVSMINDKDLQKIIADFFGRKNQVTRKS